MFDAVFLFKDALYGALLIALTCSVIGADAQVAGRVTRCVVWPGSVVAAHEQLTDAIRYGRSNTVSMS